MKNKITLETIASAISKNCVIDTTAPKPLTLRKYQNGIKNKGIGRLLCIYLADRAGLHPDDVMNYLEMDKETYFKRWQLLSELLERGRDLFEAKRGPSDDQALYFYRKLLIIESALHSPL